MARLLDYLLTPRGLVVFTIWLFGAMVAAGLVAAGFAKPLVDKVTPIVQSFFASDEGETATASNAPDANLSDLEKAVNELGGQSGTTNGQDLKLWEIGKNYNAIKEEIENQGAYFADPETGEKLENYSQPTVPKVGEKAATDQAVTETEQVEEKLSEQKSRLGFKSVNSSENDSTKKLFKSVDAPRSGGNFRSVEE